MGVCIQSSLDAEIMGDLGDFYFLSCAFQCFYTVDGEVLQVVEKKLSKFL